MRMFFSLIACLLWMGCSQPENSPVSVSKSNLTFSTPEVKSLYDLIIANENSNIHDAQRAAEQLMLTTTDSTEALVGKFYYWKTQHLKIGTQRELDTLQRIVDQLPDTKFEILKLEKDYLYLRYYQSKGYITKAAELLKKAVPYIAKDEYTLQRNAIISWLSINTTVLIDLPLPVLEKMISKLNNDQWTVYHSRTYMSYIRMLERHGKYAKSKELYNFLMHQNEKFNLQTELAETWVFYGNFLLRKHDLNNENPELTYYLTRAIEKCLEIDFKMHLQLYYRLLGHHYFSHSNYDLAYNAYSKSVKIDSADGKRQDLMQDTAYKGWALYSSDPKKNFKKAHELYDLSIASWDQASGVPEYEKIGALERKLWSLPNGTTHEMQALQEEILRFKNQKDLVSDEASIDGFKTQFKINMSELENATQNLKIANDLKDKELSNKNLVLLILLFAILFIGLVALEYRKRNRLNKQIEIQNKIIKDKNDLLQLSIKNLKSNQKKLLDSNNKLIKVLERKDLVVKRLEKFAVVLAHDFKSPLNNIKMFCTILNKTIKEKVTPKEYELFTNISSISDRLTIKVDNLYNLSNNTMRLMQNFKPVDLTLVLENVMADLHALISESNTEIEVENLGSIEGDEGLIHQLFLNLLSNAIKFRRTNIAPRIQISKESNANKVVIKIADNGIGINKTDENLFQLLARNSDKEANGFGLACCKEIVDFHGGEIWYISKVDEGTSFFVSFTNYIGATKKDGNEQLTLA